MAAKWYYQDRGPEQGPLTAVELRRLALDGEIHLGTLVRRSADNRWFLASKVRGLFDEAVRESNGEIEEPPVTHKETGDVLGFQAPPFPSGSIQADGDFAVAEAVSPPPFRKSPSMATADPLGGPKPFIKSIRSNTYYPFLRSLIRLTAYFLLLIGGILMVVLLAAGVIAATKGDPTALFLVLGGAAIGFILFFAISVFYESSSILIDIADVLIEQSRRHQQP